ncbi:3887_t:CDS:1, partial [Rhizophagus irregularis]
NQERNKQHLVAKDSENAECNGIIKNIHANTVTKVTPSEVPPNSNTSNTSFIREDPPVIYA